MLTMREILDIVLVENRINLDNQEQDSLNLLGLAQQLKALHCRVIGRLAKSSGTDRNDAIDETYSGVGVSPQVVTKRAERDIKRRDQLNQLTKKQAAVRASMGT